MTEETTSFINANEIRSTLRLALTWWTHISLSRIPRPLNHRTCWIHKRGNRFRVKDSLMRLKQVYLHAFSGCLIQTQYYRIFGGTGDAIACLSEKINRPESTETGQTGVGIVERHRDDTSINSAWPCLVLTKSGLRIRPPDKDKSHEHCHRYNIK